MTMGPGHIELAGLGKSYDGFSKAVDGVNLKIPNGSYCCFLGPSGCGKTTILRMIAGHEDPSEGEILIGGENVIGLAPIDRRTAMKFQSYALFPHLSVRDNIAFALRVRGQSSAERLKNADEMIERVRLTELRDRLPSQLSGGQQQRVALARAAITGPRVLLLDEPLSALDEQLRVQMRQELRRMQQDLGITFVHVTHTQMEAIALADMVVVMDKGHIKQAGAAREVYSAPMDRYVAEFLGGQNVIAGRVESVSDGTVTLRPLQTPPLVVPLRGHAPVLGAIVNLAVRRDDVELQRPNEAGLAPGWVGVPGRVRAVEYQGYFVKVMLDPVGRDEFVAYVPERRFYDAPFAVGDVAMAAWSITNGRLLA